MLKEKKTKYPLIGSDEKNDDECHPRDSDTGRFIKRE